MIRKGYPRGYGAFGTGHQMIKKGDPTSSPTPIRHTRTVPITKAGTVGLVPPQTSHVIKDGPEEGGMGGQIVEGGPEKKY